MTSRNHQRERVPVLIAGAGPSGLTLALDLARRDVRCHVIEATTERAQNPRCNTTSARSMEIFRRLGLADDVRRAGLPEDYPTSVHYRADLHGPEIFRVELPSSADVLAGVGKATWPGPEPQHRISQLFLEPILERHAASAAGVTVERGARLIEFTQDDGGVEAVVETEGGRRVIQCDYLVGCDGAHSTVRRTLDIRYQGVDALNRFVSTYVRSPELGRIAAKDPAWTYWTYRRRPSALIAIDGADLWLNHVAFDADHDTTDEDPEQLLSETIGGPVEHEVIGVVRWTGRQLVAERYQDGRVFLAGDAAHIWIPAGGFGMNTGIQDAASLGWMLAAVMRGWAPAELLGAYELERKPVGEQFAQAVGAGARTAYAAVSPDVHLPGTAGEKARRHLAERLLLTEPARYSPNGFSFGYHYATSPLVVGAEEHPAVDMAGYPTKAQVGFRLPHVWLSGGESVLDVLGDDFTLLRTDSSVDVAGWNDAADRTGVPLTIVDIPAQWQDRYPTALILVRPDQHIAWLGDAHADPTELLYIVTGRDLARRS
ncbi:MAG: FAD-dependent monooxygenase [Nocardioides sp.]|nr:FAD-dependent monooxygenase [Nocardioides sp.]